jgi:hypothetical protein
MACAEGLRGEELGGDLVETYAMVWSEKLLNERVIILIGRRGGHLRYLRQNQYDVSTHVDRQAPGGPGSAGRQACPSLQIGRQGQGRSNLRSAEASDGLVVRRIH